MEMDLRSLTKFVRAVLARLPLLLLAGTVLLSLMGVWLRRLEGLGFLRVGLLLGALAAISRIVDAVLPVAGKKLAPTIEAQRINLGVASLLLFSVALLSCRSSGDPVSPYMIIIGTLAALALAAAAVRYAPRRAPVARVLVFKPRIWSFPP
jgi:hypothetical protein